MAAAIFTMCALTCAACCWMLIRANRARPHRVLFWSALCFVGLTANNLLLLVDKFVAVAWDLSTVRLVLAQLALLLLVYGLLGDKQS